MDSLCSDELLLKIIHQQLDDHLAAPVLDHIERCAYCQQRLDHLAADDSEWQHLACQLAQPAFYRGAVTPDFESAHRETIPTIRFLGDGSELAKQLLSPPTHPEMLGRIGRYEVERLIGAGGMGVVFKAYDTELNRPVAVKVLAPYLSGNDSARKRFAREARAAAAVVHEHVVPIHNVETEEQTPFLVMKYVAGESLQTRLNRQGALQLCEILRIGMQVASGLSAAHLQGLVHRDIKPSNILLEETVERALITDFGLARSTDDATLTHTGFHPGTPQFMSPEQAAGENIDARSDLFSFGSVLYSMCTGKPPFQGSSSLAVMRKIIDDKPVPIQSLNPAVPAWLCAIVERLLSKCPADRYQDAEQVSELLQSCLAHVQQPHNVPLPTELKRFDDGGRGARHNLWSLLIFTGFVAAIWLGIAVVLELNKGQLRIESEIEEAQISITKRDQVVNKLKVDSKGTTVRIAAGQYMVELTGISSSAELRDVNVTIQPGKTTVVRVERRSVNLSDKIPAEVPVSEIKNSPESFSAVPIAMAIVVHPDTMRNGQSISRAFASSIVNRLAPQDSFGVIHFTKEGCAWMNGRAMEPLGNHEERQRWLQQIGQTFAGDMPDLGKSLEMAELAMRGLDVSGKHIFVLTSGTMAQTLTNNDLQLRKKGIKVSAIQLDYLGIGINQRLRDLTKQTGGRFTYLLPSQIGGLASAVGAEMDSLRVNDFDKLTKIGRAFHEFHDNFHHFPASANRWNQYAAVPGYPYSWRVALLPHLGYQELYDEYHFHEAWDSPHNSTLLARMPDVYRSSNTPPEQPLGTTHFLGVATKNGGLAGTSGKTIASFTRGLTNTILVVESRASVPWTKPEDLQDPTQLKPMVEGQYQVLLCDGSAKTIPQFELESWLPKMPVALSLYLKPYKLDANGSVVLRDHRWLVSHSYRGVRLDGTGWTDEGVTLFIQNPEGSFSAGIIQFNQETASRLKGDLDKLLAHKNARVDAADPMTVTIATRPYPLNDQQVIHLPTVELDYQLLPTYVRVDENGQSTTDNRITLVLVNRANFSPPLVVSMNQAVAEKLQENLKVALEQPRVSFKAPENPQAFVGIFEDANAHWRGLELTMEQNQVNYAIHWTKIGPSSRGTLAQSESGGYQLQQPGEICPVTVKFSPDKKTVLSLRVLDIEFIRK